MSKYIIIAGVNGAGKSTLFQSLDSLHDMERINTDEIVKSFGNWENASDVMKAGKIAVKKIDACFQKGVSFNQETTLCGNAILNNISKAKNLGYEVEIHYVGVENVELAKARIAYRVAHGGHDIPDTDVERRYLESFNHLYAIKDKCDLVVLYDNTKEFNRFAVYTNGKFNIVSDEIPLWFNKYVNHKR